jgi:hypothetical protein
MKIYIDTEFNEFKGQLISMALVAQDGSEFYEVLECENPGAWVAQNVMPILNKTPVTEYVFKHKLAEFLSEFDTIELIADWPEDIKHFCEQVITGPGMMMNIPSFTCHVRRDLSTSDSRLPHNALADAHALWEADIEHNLRHVALDDLTALSQELGLYDDKP